MSQPVMRRFETTVYKNKSPSDTSLVAAAATLTLYRRGATVASTVTIPEFQFDVPIPVYDPGLIAFGDNLKVDPGSPTSPLQVSEVIPGASPVIKVGNNGPSVTVNPGDRLILTGNQPKSHIQPLGTDAGSSTIQTDPGTGRAWGYINVERFDYVVTGSGISPRVFPDATGGVSNPTSTITRPVQRSDLLWINAVDFATIQEAIDAAPPTGAVVYIPQGDYDAETLPRVTPLLLPTDRPITLLGDGVGRTRLTYAFNAVSYDPNAPIVHMRSSDQTVESMTIEGGGGLPVGTGPGIRISAPGDPATDIIRGIVIRDSRLTLTNGWGIEVQDVTASRATPVGVVIDHVDIHAPQSDQAGGVYLGMNSTWHVLRDCNLRSGLGTGVVGEKAPGITLINTTVEDWTGDHYVRLTSCDHSTLLACWFEGGSPTPYIKLDGSYQGVSIDSCTFRQRSGPNQDKMLGIHVGGTGHSVSIRNPDFQVTGTYANTPAIHIESGCECVVEGGRLVDALAGGGTLKWPVITDGGQRTAFVNAQARIRFPILTSAERDGEFATTWRTGDAFFNSTVDSLVQFRQSSGAWAPLAVLKVPDVASLPTGVDRGTLAWVDSSPTPELRVFTGTGWSIVLMSP